MIEVEGLTRYYGSFPAVRDVSFSIGDRVIVGFLGLNGAGKSTVLKVLGGLLAPSAGNVRVGGVDVMEAPDSLRQRIGFLPEEPPLYREMRVRDFLLWCGQIKGLTGKKLVERVDEVMKLCHLEHRQLDVIDTLSHGYRKRVGIAQAIVHNPELVILDEPISGLDPVQIVEMREVLRNLKGSCTVLVSSHILSEISQTCDRILVLHKGRIVAEGSEDELTRRLQKRAQLNLTLRGGRDEVESVLKSFEPVRRFDFTQTADDIVGVRVALDSDTREELVRRLVEAGVGIRRVEETASELENVFLGLTAEEQGPEDGDLGTNGTLDTAAEKAASDADAAVDNENEQPGGER